MKMLHQFLADESGATAIEYGIIAAIMGVGLLTTLTSFKGSVVGYYEYIVTEMLAAFGFA